MWKCNFLVLCPLINTITTGLFSNLGHVLSHDVMERCSVSLNVGLILTVVRILSPSLVRSLTRFFATFVQ